MLESLPAGKRVSGSIILSISKFLINFIERWENFFPKKIDAFAINKRS